MTDKVTPDSIFSDQNELLLRQVHPTFIQDNRVTSQAFKPTPKDENKLSVSRSSKTTAEKAHKHYTKTLKLESACVMAVSVSEIIAHQKLQLEDNPISGANADQSHALVDYTALTSSEKDKVAKKLAANARARGIQYPT